ncbi:MAG: RNA-directed DNA polymerase [Burkholderiales bacterium]|jgi:hypothetical protein|nr:RNA-directed DNA polymerase [Burkholderiales bacterium]
MAKLITQLSAARAKAFFLRAESYCSLSLPSYFDFNPILKSVYFKQKGKKLNSIKNENEFKDIENPNVTIYANKDGKYAWRPHTLIHPVLYIDLIQTITEPTHWKFIKTRFEKSKRNTHIECVSIPCVSARSKSRLQSNKEQSNSVKEESPNEIKSNHKKHSALQIQNWWETFEQRSIQLGLEFECFLQTDIADFYPSIYTHTIPWALHGRTFSKSNTKTKNLIGNCIDNHLQSMQNRQTNGIPQGSTVMDFIAEMVLGYADRLLSICLKKKKITEYKILRYRDDYRIFTNNPKLAQDIAKELTIVLLNLNLKLNTSKTKVSNNIVIDSVKEEKRYWLDRVSKPTYLPKQLLQITIYAEQFPNAGYLSKVLTDFFDKLSESNENKENNDSETLSMLSMCVNLLLKNPRSIPVTVSIISVLLNRLSNTNMRDECIEKISKKISTVVHTDFLEVWVQRLTLPIERKNVRSDKLIAPFFPSNLVQPLKPSYTIYKNPLSLSITETKPLFSKTWISCIAIQSALDTLIFNQSVIDNLSEIIERREFEIFTNYHG